MSIIDTLITDRSASDVARWRALKDKGLAGMSPQELAEWFGGMKGAYNAADLNRVGTAMAYLAGIFQDYGYAVTVSSRTDWAVGEIPSKADMDAYLADVAALKAALCGSVPLPDGMSKLTAEGANNIERLLCEVERNINLMIASWHYCGELYAGEV